MTAPAGTLLRLKNAVITPGGEIAKRRAFVNIAALPSTSFGLAATESSLYVFGRNVVVTPPTLTVPGVTMKALKVPDSATDLVQSDFDVFDGRVYMVGSKPSGADAAAKNPHFYDDAAGNAAAVPEGNGKGFYVRTFQTKVYAISGKYLYFSAVTEPRAWNKPSSTYPSATGQGFVNLSMQDADSEVLTSLEVYYDKLAIFSSEAIQVWAVDPDPLQNAYTQLLRGSGTYAPRSPLQYGNGDVLFLDHSGIRSMKAKDSSNSASVSDIGSPIDSIISQLEVVLGQTVMSKAIALLEPYVGRFWLVLPDRVYVLSYFPGPKVTAWSDFTLPFTVQYAVSCGGRLFFRDTANNLWLYGGNDALQYDNCGVEVRLPYLDGKKPGHKKQFTAFDATISGTWRVAVSFDFDNPDVEETIGTFSKSTWNAGRAEMVGYDSHFSMRFYNDDALYASISNCAAHYEMASAED